MTKASVGDLISDWEWLGDRVAVEPDAVEAVSQGGVIIPETVRATVKANEAKAKAKMLCGTVLAVGPGRTAEDGTVVPMPVAVGDTVVYSPHAGWDVVVGAATVKVFRAVDLLAKIEA